MRALSLACLLFATSLAACTFQPQPDGTMESEFHPPLTYPSWGTQDMVSDSGKEACAVVSGYNGLEVLLVPGGGVRVNHQHRLAMGTVVTLNVGGHTYRTSTRQFPLSQSQQILSDLQGGGKAYLEWSDIFPAQGATRLRGKTIIPLDGFKLAFESCRRKMGA